ncbi:MAG: biopolymer transport protein ExbD/TolR [Parcubacteria group bacterium Gr01-1014_20]|nr:MAG: biopolymer transport protein ExbD/TolR [Parcubacteria group bacterium Gr01-1014_20]
MGLLRPRKPNWADKMRAKKKFRSERRRAAVHIDMTPMVDIGFLLLIFYMSTTQFKPPEQKDVTLPRSTSERKLPKENFITVTVTKEDSIYVDYVIKVREFDPATGDSIDVPSREYIATSPERVGREVKRMQANAFNKGIRELYLAIKGDRDASFGAVEKVMKSLQEENLNSFQVVTDLDRSLKRTTVGGP